MPNPQGINAYGTNERPDDDILREKLLDYKRRGLTVQEQLTALQTDLGYGIKKSTLHAIKKNLEIPSVRNPPPMDVVRQEVIDEVDKDKEQGNGPEYVQAELRKRLVLVPRDTVSLIMHELYPEGFEKRFPGKKKDGHVRVALQSAGPWREVHSDGHEKLTSLALRMGEIGLPMYGFKDKFTGSSLWLRLYPNIRQAGALLHILIDFIEHYGCIPVQFTTDMGSEIKWIMAIATTLRQQYAPDIDVAVFPVHVALKSVHNTPIEGHWRQWQDKQGHNMKVMLLQGQHIFRPDINFHTPLFYYIFVPLVQGVIDGFRSWWNDHRVRKQKEKALPSGHVPSFAMDNPEAYGGKDCRIPIPPEAIHALREIATEAVGPRHEHLSWYSSAFQKTADQVYDAIGKPKIDTTSGWEVFQRMAEAMTGLFDDVDRVA